MFNKKITDAVEEIKSVHSANKAYLKGLEDDLNTLVAKALEDSKAFQKAIADSENASEYAGDSMGIYRWYRVGMLADVPMELRDAVADYLRDRCIDVNWDSDCFHMYAGECITVQHGMPHRSDNGAWNNNKLVIPQADYVGSDGDIDEEKLCHLLERYMESTGVYGDVVWLDYHDNVAPITDTLKKAEAYRARPVVESTEEDENA